MTKLSLLYLPYYLLKKKKIRKRSVWVKPWLWSRINLGLYETLVQELRFKDESEYKKLLRMTPQDFDEILGLVQDEITTTNKNMRDSIPANIKLAVTIRFLFCFVSSFQQKIEKFNSSFFPSSIHKYKYSKSCFYLFMF